MRPGQAMRDRIVVFFVMMMATLGTTVSKPLWSTLTAGDNYLYPTGDEVNAQPQYLAAYQSSPYYVYNVHANVGDVPAAVFAAGKPEVAHIPAYSFYYGMPIYNIGIPLNPIYPVLTPSHPGLPGRPLLPPTSTQEPFDVDIDDDRIEKLDSKVEPGTETKKPANSGEQDEDSITVEAI
ncbi:PREDICTED: uncharacterized protein LOC106747593 [Dinoponera quadriceps]|uniref:Uncharacterized protein LOC106747593 n=1 Tax=Dinoponera quadriceps TaxID=609295 RepID=A0A6P3XQU2_DINQU|nr:PREDICTED: uncharacterized protein LOC106747593 [Dinoponera quadriceps]XP_014480736.1 PREDICTED: uncharacterized protein LOC106747593 [Dinoponera quadriceps]